MRYFARRRSRSISAACGRSIEVDFALRQGELKSIIGPNGAGKTTLFNLIAGVFRPTSGKVFFEDRDISRLSLHRTSRLGITKTFQITHLFPNLTVFENVRISAQSRRDDIQLLAHDPLADGAQ